MVIVQRNVLLLLTLLAFVVVIFSVIAVANLQDSKVFQPFIVEVDNRTGMVTQVSGKEIEQYTADDAVITSFLAQFVRSYESYHWARQTLDFNTVKALSGDEVFQPYNSLLRNQNTKKNPIVRLGRKQRLDVEIESISLIDKQEKIAQVHFSLDDINNRDNRLVSRNYYIATLTYDFNKKGLKPSARIINPLGFQITSYRRDVKIKKG